MLRVGNVPASVAGDPVAADGVLDRRSYVLRYTVGAAFSAERNLRFKVSTELWQFGDRDADGKTIAVGAHLGAVGRF
jgi:hypothetical protein